MQTSITTQVIALAGLCQALKLVQGVARTQQPDKEQMSIALASIANLSPETPLDIYGGSLQNVSAGLQLLADQLGDTPKKDVELTRYVVGVLSLERRLNKAPEKLQQLSEQLQQLERQLQHFAVTDDNMVGRLADIYSDCISSLGARIQVYGQPELLQQSAVQQKVRALLLAAIRSAVLWRQAGGSRLHFIFKRRKLVAEARQLLSSVQ